MFTGIVQAKGKVTQAQARGASVRLGVDTTGWVHRANLGDSMSVSGVCVTVAQEPAGSVLEFDVIAETLAKTSLGALRVGSTVNLEQAATLATSLDGHIVQGHVDGVAEVVKVDSAAEWRIRVRPPAALMEYIAPKGSVALDGVSLTVAALDVANGWFEVALIPTTLAKTTLGNHQAGDRLNIECDAMAKTVVHWLRNFANRESGKAS